MRKRKGKKQRDTAAIAGACAELFYLVSDDRTCQATCAEITRWGTMFETSILALQGKEPKEKKDD